jgi:hypothetical protein
MTEAELRQRLRRLTFGPPIATRTRRKTSALITA